MKAEGAWGRGPRAGERLASPLRSRGTLFCVAPLAFCFPLSAFILHPSAFILSLAPGQSVLDAAGPQAGRIGWLWWLMFGVLTAVYVVVMAFVIAGAFRRRRPYSGEAADAPDVRPEAGGERRMTRAVQGAVALTVLILLVLLGASYSTGRAVFSDAPEWTLAVQVTGHQWWWEVEYEGSNPSENLTTANEIHIPTGRPVLFKLTSNDVIHSFWVPNLHGKTDLIPGHTTTTWLKADRPGKYRGQCAEFCGYQHAHMAFVVVAEPEEDFMRWYAAQLKPAAEPTTPERARGRDVFLSSPCVTCHRIQGTEANGTVGPDLTHVGSRESIAAATLPNTRGHLGGWVLDPQKTKPGAKMPQNNLEPEDLKALLDYLESLK
jgi:cytochrome c oxidase subunit II